jgi:hypothetical protein
MAITVEPSAPLSLFDADSATTGPPSRRIRLAPPAAPATAAPVSDEPAIPSPDVAAKAQALLDGRRVILARPGLDRAMVFGFNDTYLVRWFHRGVTCSCPAGASGEISSCSHKVAALVMLAERDGVES